MTCLIRKGHCFYAPRYRIFSRSFKHGMPPLRTVSSADTTTALMLTKLATFSPLAQVTPGAIWLNDACEVRVGTTYTALTEVKIAAGGTYVLQRVAADFGNVGASATYSLQCPTACNSTGGTDRAFCDYNKTGNTLIGMPVC